MASVDVQLMYDEVERLTAAALNVGSDDEHFTLHCWL